MKMLRTVAIVSLLAMPAGSARAEEWPQFRGPRGTGISTEARAPLHWDAQQKVRWRTTLPAAGNSSPIVSGSRVFVTVATDEGHRRHLLCLDRDSGALAWDREVAFAGDEPTHETNPACSSTPAADGERVIVWHGSAGLFCYDYDGRELWSRDLGAFEHIWGTAASPALCGDDVIMNCGPGVRSFVAAIDRRSGEVRWQVEVAGGASGLPGPGKEDEKPAWIGSWSTPVVVEVEGRPQVLVSQPHQAVAYEPMTGRALWSVSGLGDLVYTSVVPGATMGVAMSGYGGPAIGFRLGGAGDMTEKNRLWRHDEKNPQRIGSGVILGERMFMVNEPGIAQCLNVATGEDLWRERWPGGKVWGSLIAVAGRLYATSAEGETVVLAPNPERMEVLARNELGEASNSTPAAAGGRLYIRTFDAVYCLE